MPNPTLIIFAGANGSGKTTAAQEYLNAPEAIITDFINTDKIAAELNPNDVDSVRISAGKIFFERFDEMIALRKSFAIETTLSGISHVKKIKQAIQAGYTVHMIYIYVDDPLLNKARVKIRVKQGGHNVPENVIEKRYFRSLYHLMNTYWNLCYTIEIYDTAYANKLIALKSPIGLFCMQEDLWKKIKAYRDERED